MSRKLSSIRVQNLYFQYDIDHPVFNDVSFTISPNEKVALMGKNGAGKSTLCKMFAGEIDDFSGEIAIDKNVILAYAGQQMPQKFFHWTMQDFLLETRGLRESSKNYFLLLELLAFDKGFEFVKEMKEAVCSPDKGRERGLSDKDQKPPKSPLSGGLKEVLQDFSEFLNSQDLPELQVSEECAVELMIEIEDIVESPHSSPLPEGEGVRIELFYTQALKFLQKCPDAESALSLEEFLKRFEIYYQFLVERSVFQKYAKDHFSMEMMDLLGELQESYEHSGGHSFEEEMREALELVGLEKLDKNLRIEMLSGGQKSRLLLAQAVLKRPDILILDEPTNNLDKYSYERLKVFVKGFSGTLIVISHDAEFLNTFVEKVLYIDAFQHTIREYNGTYEEVEREVAEQMDRERSEAHRLNLDLKKRKALYQTRAQQAQVYSGATALAKSAQQMKKKIEEIEASKKEGIQEDKAISRFFLNCEVIDDSLLSIDNISRWDGENAEPIDFQFEFPKSSFVLLAGANGMGKSWFLKEVMAYAKAVGQQGTEVLPDTVYAEMGQDAKKITKEFRQVLKNHQRNQLWEIPSVIARRNEEAIHDADNVDCFALRDSQGEGVLEAFKAIAEKVWFSAKARLAYYSQDFSTLNYKNTVQKEMERIHPFKYEELRGTLAKFMFTEKQLDQKVEELSEGQKALLSWAQLTFLEPNLLFLDEPTNHINFRHLPVIQEMLKAYRGTTLLVCHDESFIKDLPISHVLDLTTAKMWKWKEWKKWK